ncbi:MAG: hypothetical protein IJ849_03810 [Selenomonadaceae bacterium]|nr:hypothetical protein [Selenomonadaceae bacterium]
MKQRDSTLSVLMAEAKDFNATVALLTEREKEQVRCFALGLLGASKGQQEKAA